MAPTTHSADIPAKTLPPISTTSSHKHNPIVPADSPDYDLDYVTKPQPDTQPNEDSVPNLAEAITLMTHELKCHEPSSSVFSGVNAKKPDTFDGSDSTTLSSYAPSTSKTTPPTPMMNLKSSLPCPIFVVLH